MGLFSWMEQILPWNRNIHPLWSSITDLNCWSFFLQSSLTQQIHLKEVLGSDQFSMLSHYNPRGWERESLWTCTSRVSADQDWRPVLWQMQAWMSASWTVSDTWFSTYASMRNTGTYFHLEISHFSSLAQGWNVMTMYIVKLYLMK